MLKLRLSMLRVLQTVSGITCHEVRGGKISIDALAKRGCAVTCFTTKLYSPKRSSGWQSTRKCLFFIRDAG